MTITRTVLHMSQMDGWTLTYSLTEAFLPTEEGLRKRYGVLVEKSNGDWAEFTDVYGDREQTVALIDQLCRCQVTPTTLQDVIYDKLGE